MTTALIASLTTYKRGRELWLYGIYPVVVMTDAVISADSDETPMVKCTSILAFGDSREEEEYADYYRASELQPFYLPYEQR